MHLIPSLCISYPYLIKFHDFVHNSQEGMKHKMRGARVTPLSHPMICRVTLRVMPSTWTTQGAAMRRWKRKCHDENPKKGRGATRVIWSLDSFSWPLGSPLEFIGSKKMCTHLPDLLLSIVLNVSKNTEGRAGYSFGVRDWMSGWQFCSKLILP